MAEEVILEDIVPVGGDQYDLNYIQYSEIFVPSSSAGDHQVKNQKTSNKNNRLMIFITPSLLGIGIFQQNKEFL